jgi:hypothetical protein
MHFISIKQRIFRLVMNVNGSLSFLTSILAIYIICYHSPPQMGHYKLYLLNIVVSVKTVVVHNSFLGVVKLIWRVSRLSLLPANCDSIDWNMYKWTSERIYGPQIPCYIICKINLTLFISLLDSFHLDSRMRCSFGLGCLFIPLGIFNLVSKFTPQAFSAYYDRRFSSSIQRSDNYTGSFRDILQLWRCSSRYYGGIKRFELV